MQPVFDPKVLKEYGKQTLDLIATTFEALPSKRVMPDIKPGFLRSQLPESAPEEGEDLKTILEDTEKYILPNMGQWQHPNFFAYFNSTMCHASVLGDMIGQAFNTPGFTWACSPASTELENIVVDWCVKMLGLPEVFLLKNKGGGMISNSIGDSIFYSVHAAKYSKMKELDLDCTSPDILKFVGYYPEHAHSQNPKALILKDVPYRRSIPIVYDEEIKNFKITPGFRAIIEKDVKDGLIPFWFGATIGTTPTGTVDPLTEIAAVCKEYGIWMNVDAAWAGSCFVCPDIREALGKGLEHANSLTIGFGKLMMVGQTSTLFYVSNKLIYNEAFAGRQSQLLMNPEYLKNQFSDNYDVTDYKDWQIGLSRRFNAIRLWFMIRNNGHKRLREHIKKGTELAEYLSEHIVANDKFGIVTKRELSLLTFRAIKDANGVIIPKDQLTDFNKKLLEKINSNGEFHIVAGILNDVYFLRFTSANATTEKSNVKAFWEHVLKSLSDITLSLPSVKAL